MKSIKRIVLATIFAIGAIILQHVQALLRATTEPMFMKL